MVDPETQRPEQIIDVEQRADELQGLLPILAGERLNVPPEFAPVRQIQRDLQGEGTPLQRVPVEGVSQRLVVRRIAQPLHRPHHRTRPDHPLQILQSELCVAREGIEQMADLRPGGAHCDPPQRRLEVIHLEETPELQQQGPQRSRRPAEELLVNLHQPPADLVSGPTGREEQGVQLQRRSIGRL